ncbi:M23 family metallopeptidase [bacterium]|nr:M23 family metallopeptidase [bacterium]
MIVAFAIRQGRWLVLLATFATLMASAFSGETTNARNLRAEGVDAALKEKGTTHLSETGRYELSRCSESADEATKIAWAELARWDLEIIAARSHLLARSEELAARNSKLDQLIGSLKELESKIVRVRASSQSFALALPVWAVSADDSQAPNDRGADGPPYREMVCAARVVMTQFQLSLDYGLDSRNQVRIAKQDAYQQVTETRSELALRGRNLAKAEVAKQEQLASLLAGLGSKRSRDELASCVREVLLARISRVCAELEPKLRGKKQNALPKELPVPLKCVTEELPADDLGLYLGPFVGARDAEPVFAVGAGTVVLCDYVPGAGLTIAILHGRNELSVYGHLGASVVRSGQAIEAGQRVGLVGQTGLAPGARLLFVLVRRGRFQDVSGRIRWLKARKPDSGD